MSEYRAVMERDLRRIGRAGFSFDDLHRRRQRRRRNQRVQSAVVGLLVAILALGSLLYAFQQRSAPRPAAPPITPGNVADLRLLSTIDVGASVDWLTTADGVVYVKPRRGAHDLLAFPAACGGADPACRPTWTADVPGRPTGTLWAGNGVVYTVGHDLRSFSATCADGGGSCDPLWVSTPWGHASKGGVIVAGNTVLVDNFDAVSAFPTSCASKTGACRPLWVSGPIPNHLGGSFAVADSTVFVSSIRADRNGPGPIYAFPLNCRRDGGECLRSAGWTPPEPSGAGFIAAASRVFLGTAIDGQDGVIRTYPASCFAHRSCRPVWRANAPGALNSPPPVAADGRVIVFSSFGANFVRAYPADCTTSCDPLWTANTVPDISWAPPSTTNGVLYVASKSQGIRAFPTDCGTSNARCTPAWAWGYAHNGIAPIGIRFVVATSDRVFAGSTDGKLYVFGIGAPQTSPGRGSDRSTAIAYGALAAIALAAVIVRRRRRVNGTGLH